jgi:hypothetical protein
VFCPYDEIKWLMHAKKQHVYALQALGHQGHQYKHFASFHSQPKAVNFGYSDSGFQGAALTCYSGCHVQRLVEHLQQAQQAVSTSLTRHVVRELNFSL